ncbi:RNA polymerase I enhancer binding protein [Gryganskiella cystojenkinii]|nr:RNA polymerase I enhancer binding protein [Gryganskiella cystojenkinii]
MDNNRGKGRKRKSIGGDDSDASFKKALVSPEAFGDVAEDPNASILAAVESAGETINSDPMEAAVTSEETAASVAALTTMADLLASTVHNEDHHHHQHRHHEHHHHSHTDQQDRHDLQHHRHEHHEHATQNETSGNSGVSEDVLRMQQQLQQQIPLDPETNTRLTREQILESMTGIPSMQQIIEGNFSASDSTQHQTGGNNGSGQTEEELRQIQDAAAATAEATSVLMNLGDASAILASLKPLTEATASTSTDDHHHHHQQHEQQHHGSRPDTPEVYNELEGSEGQQGEGDSETLPPIVSKRKASGPGIRRRFESPEPSTQDPETLARTLEQQLEIDLAVRTSTNPLHTKWLMATALKDKGIAYKTGTFSTNEDDVIRKTIREYVIRNKMPEDAIQRWFNNGATGRGRLEKNDLKALWIEIAVRLQTRPLLNIYLHVRRMFHPQNNVGAWSKDDDTKLVQLFTEHKGQWTTIGQELGRMADSCRDRYRNHLKDLSTMVTGPWKPDEDEQLLGIMQELALKQGKASILDSNPMWTQISERMGGTRTRHQCRHRFSQTLQPRLERGEWTGPSSAAAAAAAAVAANASSAAAAVKQQIQQQQQQQHQQQQQQQQHQQQQQQQQQQQHQSGSNSPHRSDDKTASAQDVMLLAAALQGVLPETSESNHLWSQAMNRMGDATNGQDANNNSINNNDSNSNLHHTNGTELHHEQPHLHHNDDPFTAAALAAAASLPLPSFVPKAPKGPIRRRGGLQQQLDVLRLILEYGYTDHVDIIWNDIAHRLREDVQESNAIQLAKIIQTHDQLDSKKQQQIQDGDSNAVAAAAATAAMAAAVAAAQAEAVASLQRIPAANQIARTFMSSRCKTEGYRQMTLKEVVKIMIEDVERRIRQRRRGSSGNQLNASQQAESDDGAAAGAGTSGGADGASSSSSSSNAHMSSMTTGAMLHRQEINDAAQQAAIEALSAHFPFLQQQQHQIQQFQQEHHQGNNSHSHHHQGQAQDHETQSSSSSSTLASSENGGPGLVYHQVSTSSMSSIPKLTAEYQQELQQQQHNRDLAERMLNVAFTNSDMNNTTASAAAAAAQQKKQQAQATRQLLSALNRSDEFPLGGGDSSEGGGGDHASSEGEGSGETK